MNFQRFSLSLMTAALTLMGSSEAVKAAPVYLDVGNFSAPVVTFSEVAPGTSIKGLTINGVTFNETGSGTLVQSGGPGDTNNISQPSALNNRGNVAGETVIFNFDRLTSNFGFGYALLSQSTLPDAVTITLFDGAVNLGSLAFAGAPDPTFTGGFAGIGDATPFTRAEVQFNLAADSFDFDNVRVTPLATVPEPSSVALAIAALASVGWSRRRGRSQ